MSLEPNWHLSCTKYLGSKEESVQITELASYCNYFSKKYIYITRYNIRQTQKIINC